MAAFPVLFCYFFQSFWNGISGYSQSAKIDVFYRADFVHYRKKAAKQHVYIIKIYELFLGKQIFIDKTYFDCIIQFI